MGFPLFVHRAAACISFAERSEVPRPGYGGKPWVSLCSWNGEARAFRRAPFLRTGYIQELLGAHPNRGAGGAGAHAGGPTGEVLAHVALHRFLHLVLARVVLLAARLVGKPGEQPRPETWRTPVRIDRCKLNHAVRTVPLAIAAADARLVDEDFA